MKKFWIVFVIIALVVGGGFGLLWMSLMKLDDSVSIDGGALVWRVGGAFPEERDDSFMGQLRSGDEQTLAEVIFAVRRAADDDRITGMVMDLRGLQTDWAKIEEIRAALTVFRRAGKPIYAYFDGAGTREYALACLADAVYMSPEANLMVLGVTAELSFMKDTLDKLGMEADFIHVGKYKSAPERMTRQEASDPNREMINAIVDDRYAMLLDMLASGRKASSDQVAGWVDQGMFDAEDALAGGLIDGVLYYEELLDQHFTDDATTYLADYVLDRPDRQNARHTVGLIYATGGDHAWTQPLGQLPGQDRRQRDRGGRAPGGGRGSGHRRGDHAG